MAQTTQRVTNISTDYDHKKAIYPVTVSYETHAGVSKRVELDEARTARFHEMAIKIAEEQLMAHEVEPALPRAGDALLLEHRKSEIEALGLAPHSFDDEVPF